MAKSLGWSTATKSLVQSLLDAVKCMSNVTELIFDWPGPADIELKLFLPTAWTSFRPNLRSLTLGRTLASVKKSLTAATPATRLVALEELFLEFDHDSRWDSDPPGEYTRKMGASTMGRVIAPFINKLAPQLQHLRGRKNSICARSFLRSYLPSLLSIISAFAPSPSRTGFRTQTRSQVFCDTILKRSALSISFFFPPSSQIADISTAISIMNVTRPMILILCQAYICSRFTRQVIYKPGLMHWCHQHGDLWKR
jgi:hypothetical protein